MHATAKPSFEHRIAVGGFDPRGGPARASSNLIYSIYQEGFRTFRVGLASAQSVVLIVLFGGLAYVQYRMLERNVQYDR